MCLRGDSEITSVSPQNPFKLIVQSADCGMCLLKHALKSCSTFSQSGQILFGANQQAFVGILQGSGMDHARIMIES